jgi:hypothetical protein
MTGEQMKAENRQIYRQRGTGGRTDSRIDKRFIQTGRLPVKLCALLNKYHFTIPEKRGISFLSERTKALKSSGSKENSL